MKGNPTDIRDLANDLDECVQNHPDACLHNPDLKKLVEAARDAATTRYDRIKERSYTPDGDLACQKESNS